MVAVEVLIGAPPCPRCEQIAALAERMKDGYGDKIDLKIYKGEEAIPKFEEYAISAVPAIVIDEKIRIMVAVKAYIAQRLVLMLAYSMALGAPIPFHCKRRGRGEDLCREDDASRYVV